MNNDPNQQLGGGMSQPLPPNMPPPMTPMGGQASQGMQGSMQPTPEMGMPAGQPQIGGMHGTWNNGMSQGGMMGGGMPQQGFQQPIPQHMQQQSDPAVGLGIAAIICGFLIAPIGLILSIVGLVQAGEFRRRTGTPSAGVVPNIIGLVVSALMIILFVVFMGWIVTNVMEFDTERLHGTWNCTDETRVGATGWTWETNTTFTFRSGFRFSYDMGDLGRRGEGTFVLIRATIDENRSIGGDVRSSWPDVGEFDVAYSMTMSYLGGGSNTLHWVLYRGRGGVMNATVSDENATWVRYCMLNYYRGIETDREQDREELDDRRQQNQGFW
ncbi:DUF4190 domain-containing protein [Candidatus Saccharibacteria bacterium]|nr:DUF4190 domain-containing protein [Candidatus Saccharibacteria bacterium]